MLCHSARAVFFACTVHTLRRLVGCFSKQPKTVLTQRKITSRQGLENAENSHCSSSTGFGPSLTTMTKLLAGRPAILTKMPASFSTTVCRTSNLFLGLRRSSILPCLQIVALFAVLFVDCEEYQYSCSVLAKCSSCNCLHSHFT